MANGWTAERCKRQSELIQRWRPWEKSKGPRTRKGKALVARNAYKGGTRTVLRSLARALRERRDVLEDSSSRTHVRDEYRNR